VLDTRSLSTEQTGMCIDGAGTLYTTNWNGGSMTRFDSVGNLLTFPWAGPFSIHPETCVVDGQGNIYTGEVDGTNLLREFAPDGTPLGTWAPAVSARGLDWIDLAADQCTMYCAGAALGPEHTGNAQL